MITFQYSTKDDVISDIIREYTRSPVSHVDIVWPDGRLFGARSNVHGLVPAGVQFRPVDYAPFSFTHQVRVPTTPEQEAAFYAFLLSQEGKPYDTWGIAGFALGRDWRSEDEWFCSELSVRAKEIAKIIQPIDCPVNWVSPRDDLMISEAISTP